MLIYFLQNIKENYIRKYLKNIIYMKTNITRSIGTLQSYKKKTLHYSANKNVGFLTRYDKLQTTRWCAVWTKIGNKFYRHTCI